MNAMKILAKKIQLESKWNELYLSNGRVTPEMTNIHEEIRDCRKQLVNMDIHSARAEGLSYNDYLHADYAS